MRVKVVGEMDEQTGEHILADLNTMPTTKVKGYVIYQPLETVFHHISRHRQESGKYGAQSVFLTNFRCLEMG